MEPGEFIQKAGGKIIEWYEGDFVEYSGGDIVYNVKKAITFHSEEGSIIFGDYEPPPEELAKNGTDADFDINVELIEEDFFPLGIRTMKGKPINSLVHFKITVSGNGVNEWQLEVNSSSGTLFKTMSATGELNEVVVLGKPVQKNTNSSTGSGKALALPDSTQHVVKNQQDSTSAKPNAGGNNNASVRFWPAGDYLVEWDGFDPNGNFDSATFRQGITVTITGKAEGKQKTSQLNFKAKKFEHAWLDSIKISKPQRIINLAVKVQFKDGGEEGLNNAGDVSPQAITYYQQPALTQRNKTFDQLRDMALDGISEFWSRHAGNIGKGVMIGGVLHEVYVSAFLDNDKGMTGPKIIFLTNGEAGRSRNWELSRKLFYNVGYLYDPDWKRKIGRQIQTTKGWLFEPIGSANDDFRMTAAHEIGHELLLTVAGHEYSKTHKGSSSIWQVDNNTPLPKNGEIDLMKYYNQYYVIARTILSEGDALGLISLFTLRFI